jgi:hypothetical protein
MLLLVGLVATVAITLSAVVPDAWASPGTTAGSWALEHAARPGTHTAILQDVSCIDATTCVAVGGYDNGGNHVPLAERRVGTTWNLESVESPHGSTFAGLEGVSCTGEGCMAVGIWERYPGRARTLAERRTDAGWSIAPTVDPPGKLAALSGVFCPGRSWCVAVGNYVTVGGRSRTLIESWDGSAWSLVPSPNPAGSRHAYLNDVTCTGPTDCAAVGTYLMGKAHRTLVERWDGSVWTVEPSADPSRARGGYLLSVSCTSPMSCIATGGQGGNYHTETLAESWDGAAWTIQDTPNPKGALFGGTMRRLSCAGVGACTAVGSYVDRAGEFAMFAVRWDGAAWSIQAPPPPNGATMTGLNGVSCVKGLCVAVGFWAADPNPQRPLAERYVP